MQENNILVSVICTAYNHEKYIKDALEGFAMQKTNFAFEALVHDDASTDNTAKIILDYAEKYPHIIKPIIQTENQHSKKIPITNDIILPRANGKYIAFCEGDDFWTDENKLQLQIDFLENNPEYIACVHNTTLHDCNKKKKDCLVVSNNYEHDLNFKDVIRGMQYAYQTSSLVIRKEYVSNMPDFYYTALKYGFGDLPRAIWYTIIGKVKFFPYNMSTYRFMSNPTSWTSANNTIKKLLRNKEGVIAMLQDVKKHVSEEQQLYLDEAILEQEFYKFELMGCYNEIMKPEFSKFWKNETKIFRIKVYIKKLFPWLYKMLRKTKE